VNITRNLLADLIAFTNNLAAFVNSLTHNPGQSAQSAGQSVSQTVHAAVSNPGGFVYGIASGAGYSVGTTWSLINSGNDAQQERGITNLLELEGGVIGGAAAGADEVVTTAAGQTVKVTDIIKGFNHDGSYHGLNQIINRGVTPQMLKDTVTNPLITTVQADGQTRYISTQAVVVGDQKGQVVTAYPSGSFNQKTVNLIQSAQ
jgi:hypothetical protein